MIRRRHLRSGAALVTVFFATTTVTVPALEAAGLPAGEQRYGIDQDGNVVALAAPAGDRVQNAPLPPAPPAGKGGRYGLNQNGELQPLPELTPAAPPPVPATQLLPRAARGGPGGAPIVQQEALGDGSLVLDAQPRPA